MNEFFRKVAQGASKVMGSPYAFIISCLIVMLWALSGPFFDYSDTWQLFINTGTTVLTFLAVFLIQNTQNRDSHAIHLKLDEIIRAIDPARNELIDIEEDADSSLNKFEQEFRDIRTTIERDLRKESED
jgi:low affinity Fe/Cu permease